MPNAEVESQEGSEAELNCKLKRLVRWTHYHHTSWGEHCIVLKIRGGLLGFIFGTHKILLEDGYTGWCHKHEIDEIPPNIVNHRQEEGCPNKTAPSFCMVDSVVGLNTGCHYWYRHVYEFIWRICYIGSDHDDNQWLHPIGSPARQLGNMDLDRFDWRLISKPNDEFRGGCKPSSETSCSQGD